MPFPRYASQVGSLYTTTATHEARIQNAIETRARIKEKQGKFRKFAAKKAPESVKVRKNREPKPTLTQTRRMVRHTSVCVCAVLVL